MELVHQQKTQAILNLSLKDKSMLKWQLVKNLESQGIQNIAEKLTGEVNMLYMTLQRNVTMDRVLTENPPSIKQTLANVGLDATQKVICVTVKYFVDSLQVQHKMGALDYLDFSFLFIEKYSHESIEDLILALKYAKTEGKILYNSFGTQNLFEIFAEYQDRKAVEREYKHKQLKSAPTQSVLQSMNDSESQEIREFVDTLKLKDFGKPKPLEFINPKTLDIELKNIEKVYSDEKTTLQECIDFKEYCELYCYEEQLKVVEKIIEQKWKNV